MSTPEIHMTLGWVIAYVDDPPTASTFYQETFGLRHDFASPDGSYAQLDTGATKLAFASYALGEKSFENGVRHADTNGKPPPNMEIVLVAEDIDSAYNTALRAGCTSLAPPEDKPHGQRVGWVRDPFGNLIELATPM